jgi:L-alanine-DL-glutamate epimerase-like enolase superfamily enzyme
MRMKRLETYTQGHLTIVRVITESGDEGWGQMAPCNADISPEDEAARMKSLRDEKGYRAFKTRIGSRLGHDQDEQPGRTEKLIPTLRKALKGSLRRR